MTTTRNNNRQPDRRDSSMTDYDPVKMRDSVRESFRILLGSLELPKTRERTYHNDEGSELSANSKKKSI